MCLMSHLMARLQYHLTVSFSPIRGILDSRQRLCFYTSIVYIYIVGGTIVTVRDAQCTGPPGATTSALLIMSEERVAQRIPMLTSQP